MKYLLIAATGLTALAGAVADPAEARHRRWDDRPGYGYRPGNVVGLYGRPRVVPVYGGYYAGPRAVRYRPVRYPVPVVRYRPGIYTPTVIYGGYVRPVPVAVGYGGYPAQVGYGGYPAQVGFGGYPPGFGYDPCRSTGTGAVIGAIAGGLIGNGIAGRYDRGLGTVVGAGLGAVAGTAVERSQRCAY